MPILTCKKRIQAGCIELKTSISVLCDTGTSKPNSMHRKAPYSRRKWMLRAESLLRDIEQHAGNLRPLKASGCLSDRDSRHYVEKWPEQWSSKEAFHHSFFGHWEGVALELCRNNQTVSDPPRKSQIYFRDICHLIELCSRDYSALKRSVRNSDSPI